MRIHRISLRNYRGVRAVDVEFAPDGVTIVQGPNEIGKTSLAEALVFLFDEPHSSSKAKLKAVKPVHIDAGPFVEVDLTTGPYRLIYSKQWHVGAKAELQVLEPAPANYTGREAHDRAQEILEETLDRCLFGALRYQQGVSVTQATLGESRTLAAALDAAAASGSLGGNEEADLVERVEQERALYFTSSGRLASDRTRDSQTLAALGNRVAEIEVELRGIDESAERHRQIGLALARNTQAQDAQRVVVQERKAVVDGLAQKEQALELLAVEAEKAHAQAEASKLVHETRQTIIKSVTDAEADVARLQGELEREAPKLQAAREAQAAAREASDAARAAGRKAEAASKVADADYTYFRETLDHQLLSERYDRAKDAEEEIRKATAFLECCLINQTKLEEIEQASTEAIEARARADAQHVSVAVSALQPLRMRVGEEVVELAADDKFERSVSEGIELTLEQIAQIRVAGKATGHAAQEAADAADARVSGLLEEIGLQGDSAVNQARELVRQRSVAERSLSSATQRLQENLRDLTLELISEKVERYQERLAGYEGERDASVPLSADLEGAKAQHETASEVLDEARRRETTCQKALEGSDELLNGLQREADTRAALLDRSQQDLASAREQLEAAQQEKSDDAIEMQRNDDDRASAEAQSARTRQAEELGAADPESERALFHNAEEVYDRLRNDQSDLELEVAQIERELEVRGQAGLADQLAAAQTEHVQLSKKVTLTDRRAAAVALLHERLMAHRDTARKSYVAPFKEQIDALARIVFGPATSVEIDHETLEVVSRTLDGVTVPYGSLSVGAKEQLCVLARLACAQLVCPDSAEDGGGGVPVIFDDALGFSDPGRLERLGAVFSVAGERSQIIVLTCVPERYKNIGSARVVNFDSELSSGA
ncbi:MAG: AAA family ATPase [Gaiellaceae bacterium]